MRFIQYARKSSEGDERQVQSIPDQNAVLGRIADQLGLEVALHLDEACSAKQPNARPVFSRMLELIQAGEADGILCWHLNRLTRNPVDSGTLSWLLQQGVIKCIKTPDREYRPEDNVVIMAVENAVSNQFIVDLRHNVRRGQLEKAARGWYPHKPPGGYITNRDTGEIEVDPERFTMLRRAWELMLSGSYSIPAVHEKLKEWGYRTRLSRGRVGQMITRSNLYELFDHPFYCGDFIFSGERYSGKHRPMVTRDEFRRVQEIIHPTDPTAPKRHSFAFTGLIRCGGCGCQITAERKVKHYRTTNRTVSYTYYRCTRSKRCDEPAVTEAYVEGEITRRLQYCRLNHRAMEWARATLSETPRTASQSPSNQLHRAQSDLASVKAKLEGLYELRLSGEISTEEFKGLRSKYQAEDARLELTLEQSEHLNERNRITTENLLSYVSDASAAFADGDDKVKREIARSLAESYVLTLGTLKIRPNRFLEPLLAIEPQTVAANMVRRTAIGSQDPLLQGWVDHIRTLLATQDVSFPKLECLQQVRGFDVKVARVRRTKQNGTRRKENLVREEREELISR